eukprot:1885218-Rhodomonas_salina.1
MRETDTAPAAPRRNGGGVGTDGNEGAPDLAAVRLRRQGSKHPHAIAAKLPMLTSVLLLQGGRPVEVCGLSIWRWPALVPVLYHRGRSHRKRVADQLEALGTPRRSLSGCDFSGASD